MLVALGRFTCSMPIYWSKGTGKHTMPSHAVEIPNIDNNASGSTGVFFNTTRCHANSSQLMALLTRHIHNFDLGGSSRAIGVIQ